MKLSELSIFVVKNERELHSFQNERIFVNPENFAILQIK
jgi:hypothetical protein